MSPVAQASGGGTSVIAKLYARYNTNPVFGVSVAVTL